MADSDKGQDVHEGRLPPSNLASLAEGVDLDGMSEDDLMGLVEEALDRLGAADLKEIRDLAEEKRQSKLQDAKEGVLAEIREKLEALGLTLSDVLPQTATSSGRRTRSDAGQPLPMKYRGPQGETWTGRGRTPGWLIALESIGQNREEFRVPE